MKSPCEHGHYDEHEYLTPGGHPESSVAYQNCPGGAKLDVDVEALRDTIAYLDDGYPADNTEVEALTSVARQVLAALDGEES